jgi:predicted Ser/Thr protein kinase
MATKEAVIVTLESRGGNVVVIVESQKADAKVKNLEVEAKTVTLVDNRVAQATPTVVDPITGPI